MKFAKHTLRAAFLFAGAGHALAADASLAGAWMLVAVDNIMPDGSRVQLYGPDPKGMLVFDEAGRYTLQMVRGDRARFAQNDKSKGTAEENKAAVLGGNSHFGHYRYDPAAHTLVFQIAYASFPNWDGAEQKRPVVVNGDRMTYTVPAPTSGAGATGEVVWQRMK